MVLQVWVDLEPRVHMEHTSQEEISSLRYHQVGLSLS